MGLYIETPERFNKARQISEMYGGKVLKLTTRLTDVIDDPDRVLICVVQNAHFDAALIVSDRDEYARVVAGRNGRKVTWMTMEPAKVRELNPRAEV